MAAEPLKASNALPAAFYQRPSLQVARDLLGCLLTDGAVTVRLVEVEAYAGMSDPASHWFRGKTPRNAIMWGPPGKLYVYFTYGMHWCMNAVCGDPGEPSAVLLRAGEVVDGVDVAAARRPDVRPRDLGRGPARLARLLGITGEENGVDLTAGAPPLTLQPGERVPIAGCVAAHGWGSTRGWARRPTGRGASGSTVRRPSPRFGSAACAPGNRRPREAGFGRELIRPDPAPVRPR